MNWDDFENLGYTRTYTKHFSTRILLCIIVLFLWVFNSPRKGSMFSTFILPTILSSWYFISKYYWLNTFMAWWVILYPSQVQFNDLEPFQSEKVPSLFCYIKEADSNWYYERLLCTETSPVPKLDLTNVAFPASPSIPAPSKGSLSSVN